MISEPRRLGRRAFLASATAGALALVLPVRFRPGGGLSVPGAVSAAAAAKPFRAKLPIPKVLRDDHITLRVREAELQILPGRKTRMWTYGGTFPAPTIRRPAGKRTRVTFAHHLPRSAGELSVHLHGGHNTSRNDGQPGGLTHSYSKSLYCKVSPKLSAAASGNRLLIRPGDRRSYVYDLMEDGEPERASFQWYHDHRLDHTGRNVWRGLAGMFILDDELDRGLPLPNGHHDIPLLICDRDFDRHNQLTNPFAAPLNPPADGVTGPYILVNGAYMPHHHVQGRRYRLRLLNASNFRAYNVYLTGAAKITQIATEAGLLPAPLERNRVLIGPAERVELIADFRDAHGTEVELRSGPRADGVRKHGSRPYKGALMQFRVGRRAPDNTSIPAELRPLPAWVADAKANWAVNAPAVDKTWTVTLGGLFFPKWQINGKTFDPARVDHEVPIGSTQVWRLQNHTRTAHMLHMHSTDFYMLERNGQPAPPWEDCLKETFFLDPQDDVVVAGKLTDHLGKFVIHCHMLDHEDHGLMAQFKVV